LTPDAIKILSCLCHNDDQGAEFGSGKSTMWFSQRVKHLTSVEHNPAWYERVNHWIIKGNRQNVDYSLAERQDQIEPASTSYVLTAEKFSRDELDFALVDGIYRDACTIKIIPKIKPGGFLIIDNINLSIPSSSRCPNSIRKHDSPVTELWRDVWDIIHHWRFVWTSNGVSDTAIFIKPAQ
jgi:predicted O-methyltransferase YrrM